MVLVPQFTQKVIECEIIIWKKPPDVQFRRQSINPLTCGLSFYFVVSVNCMNDILIVYAKTILLALYNGKLYSILPLYSNQSNIDYNILSIRYQ